MSTNFAIGLFRPTFDAIRYFRLQTCFWLDNTSIVFSTSMYKTREFKLFSVVYRIKIICLNCFSYSEVTKVFGNRIPPKKPAPYLSTPTSTPLFFDAPRMRLRLWTMQYDISILMCIYTSYLYICTGHTCIHTVQATNAQHRHIQGNRSAASVFFPCWISFRWSEEAYLRIGVELV